MDAQARTVLHILQQVSAGAAYCGMQNATCITCSYAALAESHLAQLEGLVHNLCCFA